MNGFSLLEVLISLFIFSITLLVVLEQQVKINFALKQSYYQFVALQQILSLVENYKSNKESALRLKENERWQEENRSLLPSGVGAVYQGGISVCWRYKVKQCIVIKKSF